MVTLMDKDCTLWLLTQILHFLESLIGESLGLVSVSRLKVPRLSVSYRTHTKFWRLSHLVSDENFSYETRRDNLKNFVRDRDETESLSTFSLETETRPRLSPISGLLDKPAGRTSSLYLKIDLSVCILSQLPSPTKALFLLDHLLNSP